MFASTVRMTTFKTGRESNGNGLLVRRSKTFWLGLNLGIRSRPVFRGRFFAACVRRGPSSSGPPRMHEGREDHVEADGPRRGDVTGPPSDIRRRGDPAGLWRTRGHGLLAIILLRCRRRRWPSRLPPIRGCGAYPPVSHGARCGIFFRVVTHIRICLNVHHFFRNP